MRVFRFSLLLATLSFAIMGCSKKPTAVESDVPPIDESVFVSTEASIPAPPDHINEADQGDPEEPSVSGLPPGVKVDSVGTPLPGSIHGSVPGSGFVPGMSGMMAPPGAMPGLAPGSESGSTPGNPGMMGMVSGMPPNAFGGGSGGVPGSGGMGPSGTPDFATMQYTGKATEIFQPPSSMKDLRPEPNDDLEKLRLRDMRAKSPQPEMPTAPGMTGGPGGLGTGGPAMPPMPGMPSMPGMPGMPSTPGMPTMPGMPGAGGMGGPMMPMMGLPGPGSSPNMNGAGLPTISMTPPSAPGTGTPTPAKKETIRKPATPTPAAEDASEE